MRSKIDRFFGPLPEAEANGVVDIVLDGKGIVEVLQSFASGVITGDDMKFQIQILMENAHERLNADRRDEAIMIASAS